MIVSFRDKGTEDVYNGADTKEARKTCPGEIQDVARRKLDQMRRVTRLPQLGVPPGNRLEPLKGGRRGEHSIRINQRYRICFVWTEHGPAAVEITDYH